MPANPRLPIRVAHPPRPQLQHLDDAYFAFLAECGYEGLYLQDSPFDGLTGNHGAFKKTFHLIYLYELARGPERQRYVDYVNEVCRRAARHGLKTHLCCWEPRLPLRAWAETPPGWRGHGGFAYAGRSNLTSFCWSEPAAVAYWKAMALDAFAALPGIAGVHLGVVDNEASFCDATCPKCRGETGARQLEDLYATLAEVKRGRPDFRIAIYDWWLPKELLARLPAIVGSDALIIGRSSQGHRQEPLPGQVEDMTAIFDGCGPAIIEKKAEAARLGLRLVDMPAWSHPNEAWMLPPPPDPRYAVEKLNALHRLGADGWYDFDCGSTEPGSISEAIRVWTRDPAAAADAMVDEVLRGIFGAEAEMARPAYEHFRAGKREFPIAYHDPVVSGFSGRSLGLGLVLFGPFRLQDLRLMDLGHVFNWFAPFNLVTLSTLPVVLPRLEKTAAHMEEAHACIQRMPSSTPRAAREKDVFEIHYRSYRAMRNYFRLGQAQRDRLEGESGAREFGERVRRVAADEAENLAATEAWHARNPDSLFNPCHNLLGTLEEVWPWDDFRPGLFAAKRASLAALLREASPA
jgi:hypothetical protein